MSSLRWLSVFAALALTFVSAEKVVQYDGYRLLRIIPESTEHIETLASLQDDRELDFWQEPRRPGLPVDVFVGPKNVAQLEQTLIDAGIHHEVVMDDPQSLIDSQIGTFAAPKPFGWDDYQTLESINGWMKDQAQKYNKIATLITAGKSVEGRTLLGIRIAHKPNLPIVFVEAGIHAREWIAPATATWFIHQALNGTTDMIKSYEWHVFPSVNPDGYAYTQTNRLWRKSRRNFGSAIGVDLNRNWPFKWNAGKKNMSSEDFPGPQPASEPETQGLMAYLNSVASRTRVYIALHSYSQLLMFPWSYTTYRPEPKNYQFIQIARKALAKLSKHYGTEYGYGSVASAIYTAYGTTIDYAYSLNITYPYVFELRDRGHHGYLLPKDQIIPTGLETMSAVEVLLEEAQKATKN